MLGIVSVVNGTMEGDGSMPHIAVSMYPGRDDEIKKKLAIKLQETVAEELKVDPKVITVSVEDVPKEQWQEHIEAIPKENRFI
ncbi:MAG: tautomerase family protein [Clostridium sp.]|nr:tautomerase family protein [Clostridium sp.]